MRSTLATNVQPSTYDALRQLAEVSGAQVNDLTDFLLRFAMSRLPPDRVREWARAQPSRRGRNAGALRTVERAALNVLERLECDDWYRGDLRRDGGVVSSTDLVARGAGLPVRDAYRALRGLQVRGLVGCAESDGRDRWGRPTLAVWWRAERAVAGVDQREVLEAVLALRRELAGVTVDPTALALTVRLVSRSVGWSREALGLPEGLPAGEGQTPTVADLSWIEARWPWAARGVDPGRSAQ